MTEQDVLDLYTRSGCGKPLPTMQHTNGNQYVINNIKMSKVTGVWVTTVEYWKKRGELVETIHDKVSFERTPNQFGNFHAIT